MSRVLVPVAIFLLVSALGTLWWHAGGRFVYGRFFVWFAEWLYGALGFHEVVVGPRMRFVNLVPFIALMVATPGFSLRQRSQGLLVGVFVLFTWHVLASFMVGWRFQVVVTFPFPLAVMSDVLPFALWVYWARDLIGNWLEPVGSNSEDQ